MGNIRGFNGRQVACNPWINLRTNFLPEVLALLEKENQEAKESQLQKSSGLTSALR